MIIPHVLKVANDKEIETGMMTKNGIFEYAKKKGTLKEFEKEFLTAAEEGA